METLLISEDLLKANSPITYDTNIQDFVPYVNIVQKMYLKPVLGIPLYEELQTQVADAQTWVAPDPYPITAANKALLTEIAPMLAFYATYQGLPFQWAKIVNKGITVRDSENSAAVGINDLAQLRRWIKDDAERLTHDLISYMCGCESYTNWAPGVGFGCDAHGFIDCRSRAPRNNYESDNDFGIYIPNRRRRGCCE